MTLEAKSANSVKIGKVFIAGRIKAGLSKNEVAKASIMNIKYIEAIESGDYSIFPSESFARAYFCLLYTSPSPRDATLYRMPSSA